MLKVSNVNNFNTYHPYFGKKNKRKQLEKTQYNKSRKNPFSILSAPFSYIRKKSATKQKELPEDLYFIRMTKYKKNKEWGRKMVELTYELSDMIKNDAEFDEILSKAIEQISLINDNKLFGSKRASVGNFFLTNHLRGQEYLEKYKKKIEEQSKDGKNLIPKSNEEYKNANTCLITVFNDKEVIIWYGRDYFSNITNISLAKEEYNKLKKIEKPSVDDINRSCATIQWLIAQECPFARGNDSIANVLTRAIYHSYGVRIHPLKAETSLDFEAFYRNLDDYIANYPSFFEKAPH